MNGSKPYIRELAEAYDLSRQGLHKLMRNNVITKADVQKPDLVFQRLLENRASHLRIRLADPKHRARIATKISKLSA